MRINTVLAAVVAAGTLAACQPQGLYKWGGYDQALYKFHREPEQREAFIEALQETIAVNEEEGRKVPPGIYAEYGYQMLAVGKSADAIAYFEKERDTWPESGTFMESMIRYTKTGGRLERPAEKAPEPLSEPSAAQTLKPGV